MATVRFAGVNKSYGSTSVVSDLDLELPDGSFTVLVGPSGCGKSTSLRMLAGLESVSSGTITIGERDVTALQPRDRDVAMVFQNYALYPHLTVRENIAFPLRATKRREPRRSSGPTRSPSPWVWESCWGASRRTSAAASSSASRSAGRSSGNRRSSCSTSR